MRAPVLLILFIDASILAHGFQKSKRDMPTLQAKACLVKSTALMSGLLLVFELCNQNRGPRWLLGLGTRHGSRATTGDECLGRRRSARWRWRELLLRRRSNKALLIRSITRQNCSTAKGSCQYRYQYRLLHSFFLSFDDLFLKFEIHCQLFNVLMFRGPERLQEKTALSEILELFSPERA